MSEVTINKITNLIGNTPIVKLQRIVPAGAADVFLKLENFNLGGSIKDRIALGMIEHAENAGVIKPGDTIIEATSGNTGVGLALVAAIKGYHMVIVMNDSVSLERRKLIRAYGSKVVLTPASEGLKGVFAETERLVREHGYIRLDQFTNPDNPGSHLNTTGPEIVSAFGGATGDLPDAFIAGVGTGGTVTGTGSYLKKIKPSIQIIAVEPAASPYLSGGTPGPHLLQGIGTDFIPGVLDVSVYDRVLTVSNEDATLTARRLAAEEGLLHGYTTGATVHAAIEVAKELGEGMRVLTIAADTGERYLSTPLFDLTPQ
jgi:cysteine synthase A